MKSQNRYQKKRSHKKRSQNRNNQRQQKSKNIRRNEKKINELNGLNTKNDLNRELNRQLKKQAVRRSQKRNKSMRKNQNKKNKKNKKSKKSKKNKKMYLMKGGALPVIRHFQEEGLLNKMNETTSLDTNYFIASTIVSTPMIKKIGGYHNVDVKLGLTGFKWIAKMIEDFPDQNFIAGGEESYGIMIGSKVRDKDAISATLLVSEMMSFYSEKNSSVFEELIKIYQKIGFYKEKLISVKKTGEKGLNEINEIMSKFRYYPIKKLNESRVKLIKDYKNSEEKNLFTNKTYKLEFPKSNVLEFEAENGYKLIFRPSGTEPKIKMYISVNTNLKTKQDFEKAEIFLENEIDKIVKEINL